MLKRLSSTCLWRVMLGCSLAVCAWTPAAQAQAPAGKWVSIAPFPEPKEEVIGVAANGKMYVMAGLVSAPIWLPVGMVYEYDPGANTWTKKKPMAMPAHHVAITEYNGKIYVFGGFVGVTSGIAAWVPIDNAFEYDPAYDTWKALAPMPIKRGAAVAAAANGKIYVIGGATTALGETNPAIHPTYPQRVLGTVEEYDPETNTWRERAPMPTPRNHTCAGAVGGKIYVIGGRIGAAFISASSNLNNVEAYDPATDKWSAALAKMPTARSAVSAGVYNNRIYVAGGEWQNSNQFTAYRAFEGYDPATNMWAVLPPMAAPRHGVAGAVIGNRFYAVSGDVQSSGTGVAVSTASADAFEFAK